MGGLLMVVLIVGMFLISHAVPVHVRPNNVDIAEVRWTHQTHRPADRELIGHWLFAQEEHRIIREVVMNVHSGERQARALALLSGLPDGLIYVRGFVDDAADIESSKTMVRLVNCSIQSEPPASRHLGRRRSMEA